MEFVKNLEEAGRILISLVDEARKRGDEGEEYFRNLSEAYVKIFDAISWMRITGKMDSETHKEITRNLLK